MTILIALAEPMLEMLEAIHSSQLKLTKVLPKYGVNRGWLYIFNVFINVFPGRRDALLCGENAVSSLTGMFCVHKYPGSEAVIQDE